MMAAETCTVMPCDHRPSAGRFGSEPVRHCLRDEAKEVRPHARPQAWKNQRCIRRNTNTLRIFSGRERRRWWRIVRRSRTVNVGRLLVLAYGSQKRLEELGGLRSFEKQAENYMHNGGMGGEGGLKFF